MQAQAQKKPKTKKQPMPSNKNNSLKLVLRPDQAQQQQHRAVWQKTSQKTIKANRASQSPKAAQNLLKSSTANKCKI